MDLNILSLYFFYLLFLKHFAKQFDKFAGYILVKVIVFLLQGMFMKNPSSSLARNMLETGASLSVITEVLGHRRTQSTSHYLRIDMEHLSKCPIDPEGVFVE